VVAPEIRSEERLPVTGGSGELKSRDYPSLQCGGGLQGHLGPFA
jgi:hypothetical protein